MMIDSRLNEFVRGLKDLRADALDGLTDREYAVFVSLGCDIFGHEAARLHLGDWLRELAEEQAA